MPTPRQEQLKSKQDSIINIDTFFSILASGIDEKNEVTIFQGLRNLRERGDFQTGEFTKYIGDALLARGVKQKIVERAKELAVFTSLYSLSDTELDALNEEAIGRFKELKLKLKEETEKTEKTMESKTIH